MWALFSPWLAIADWDLWTRQPCPLSTPSHCTWRHPWRQSYPTEGWHWGLQMTATLHQVITAYRATQTTRGGGCLIEGLFDTTPAESCWTGQWNGCLQLGDCLPTAAFATTGHLLPCPEHVSAELLSPQNMLSHVQPEESPSIDTVRCVTSQPTFSLRYAMMYCMCWTLLTTTLGRDTLYLLCHNRKQC